MYNPLKVSLENIIPLTEARDHFSQIVNEVQKDKLYVLTKGGKPAIALVDVKYLEAITGGNVNTSHVEQEIQKNPAKVGRPEMIKHETNPTPTPTPPPTSVPTPTPISAPKPFTPSTPPPPPTPKPQPPITQASPTPPPLPSTPPPPQTPPHIPVPITPPAPSVPPTPPVPSATASISNSFSNPTPAEQAAAKPNQTIEIHPLTDVDDQQAAGSQADRSDATRVEPDDKTGPAQYPGDGSTEEPDDMPID